jgi:hypothetical protein
MHEKSGGTDGGGAGGSGPASAVIQVERPESVLLDQLHRIADFRCSKSERINRFFAHDCQRLLAFNYCRVFILPNPDDPTEVWGYYTLSPSLLSQKRTTRSDQNRTIGGYSIPMVLIGYMGKHDGAPKGFGKSILVDAARRVYWIGDLAAWGIMLDSEGGPDNKKLWEWYQQQGFKIAKPETDKENPDRGVLYAALKQLIPELAAQSAARPASPQKAS